MPRYGCDEDLRWFDVETGVVIHTANAWDDGDEVVLQASRSNTADIAGAGKANPLATILSAAMLLRYSLDEGAAANAIEAAVEQVLNAGLRTRDIASKAADATTTEAMGDAVVAVITSLS